MKIRSGFVSNSSSSSFVCYGISIDLDELKKALGVKEEDDVLYAIEEALEKKYPGFSAGNPYDDYSDIYIGRKYTSMKDDETAKQFKDSVKDTLGSILGKDVKPDHIEESSYNG